MLMICSCDSIENEFTLKDALSLIGQLFDILEATGMLISIDKTVVLLRLAGLKAKQVLKNHVHRFRGARMDCNSQEK